jgi:quercetin dioxygenase-like cupin family protein
VVAPALLMSGTSAAHDDQPAPADPEPITVELLTPRSRFTDDVSAVIRVKARDTRARVMHVNDPSFSVVARITLQPGARFPWHYHAGPVMVTVAEGELILTNADCVDRPYASGSAFIEPTRMVHTARNQTDHPTVLIATYLDVSADGPLSIAEGFPTPTCHIPGPAADHAGHGGTGGATTSAPSPTGPAPVVDQPRRTQVLRH